jgi:hypothetical protein
MIADIAADWRDFAFVPTAVIGASLVDHLVGPCEQRFWDGESERLGSLEVDHQLKLCRLLHWEVTWLGALENLVHVGRGAPKQVADARSVGHEAAQLRKFPGVESKGVRPGCHGAARGRRGPIR